jgi:hypothetical protein
MNTPVAICSDCGNNRHLFATECPFCGLNSYLLGPNTKWQIQTINLEMNMPSSDEALERFHIQIEKLRSKGLRVVKVIHGHGSSGKGGIIRHAFRNAMEYGLWREYVLDVYYGEILSPKSSSFQELTKTYPAIKKSITKDIYNNPGITLLVLDKNS